MKNIIYLLPILYIIITATAKSSPEFKPVAPTISTNNEYLIDSRGLKSENSSSCLIQNCLKCNSQLSQCDSCEIGFTNHASSCITNPHSEFSFSSFILIFFLICFIALLVVFCFIFMIYINNQKRSYVKCEDKNETKILETLQHNTNLHHSNSTSPQSSGGLFAGASLSSQVQDAALLSLDTLTEDEGFDEDCVICFSSMRMMRLKRLKCEHAFHYDCCKDWILEGNEKCPVCCLEIN